MSLKNIIRVLSNQNLSQAPEIPFDDTITFNIDAAVDNDPDYHYLGNYLQNPVNKKVLHVFANSSTHVWGADKKISAKISTDEGQTRGTIFDVYDPADPFGVNEFGAGYDNSGTLHIMAGERNGSGSGDTNRIMYMYSNDDGVTTSTPVEITMPSDGMYGFWPHGRIIENNGVLFKNVYRIADAGDTSTSINYVLRSTDYGANWTAIVLRAEASPYYNEADIIALSDSNLLVLLRDDTNQGFQQYQSDDNGLTWSADGAISFGETTTQIRPPSLRRFNINNHRVIVFYGANQNPTHRFFGVYAKASDLISSGLSGWNLSTKTTFTTAPYFGWYGNAVHFNNTLRAIYEMYSDQGDETTHTLYMTLPTTQYDTIINELGL